MYYSDMSCMDRLVNVRKYRDIPQSEIADLLGIATASWSRKEKGTIKGFSFDDVQKILNLLNVDARWIFGQKKCSLEEALLENAYDEINNVEIIGDIDTMNTTELKKTMATIQNKLSQFDKNRDKLLKDMTYLINSIENRIEKN